MSKSNSKQNSVKRGRPKQKITKEIKELVEHIIYRYRKEVKPRGLITINGIVKYSEELYQKKQIDYKLKEHFWKRGYGRSVIDNKNKVIQTVPNDNELTDKEAVVDTVDAVEKLYKGKPSDKKKIISSLRRNEVNLIRVRKENETLRKKIKKLETELEKAKQEKTLLSEDVKELQEMFFSWLDASVNNNNPLINTITTGPTRSSVVDEFFVKAFNNPTDGIKKFQEYRNAKSSKKNVVSIDDTKKKSILDEMKF